MDGFDKKKEQEDLTRRIAELTNLLNLTQHVLPENQSNEQNESLDFDWSFRTRNNVTPNPGRVTETPKPRSMQAQAGSTDTCKMDQLGKTLAESFALALNNVMGTENRTPVYRSLPEYRGYDHEDPNNFINRLREYFRKNRIEEDSDKVSIASEQLKEDAASWFEPYKPLPLTFRNFQDRLLNKYNSTSTLAIARSKLYGDRQKETEQVTLFITRKRGLFTRLDPDANERMITETITEQLRPEIRSRLRVYPCKDVEDLIRISSQIENDLEKIAAGNTRRQRNAANAENREHDQGKEQQERPENGSNPNICRRCPDVHLFKDCPKNRRQGNGWRVGNQQGAPTTFQPAQ